MRKTRQAIDDFKLIQSRLGGTQDFHKLVHKWALFTRDALQLSSLRIEWKDPRTQPLTLTNEKDGPYMFDLREPLGTWGIVSVATITDETHVGLQALIDIFVTDMRDRAGDGVGSCIAFCDKHWKVQWATDQWTTITGIGLGQGLPDISQQTSRQTILKVADREYVLKYARTALIEHYIVEVGPVSRTGALDAISDSDDDSSNSGAEADVVNLTLGGMLGRGGFGTVYRAVYKGIPVAVKIIPNVNDTLPREIAIGKRLDHPNIIKTITWGIKQKQKELWIVLELCAGGSLSDQLKKPNGQQTAQSFREIRRIALEIAYGMKYIHGMGLLHGDLSANNIMFDASGTVKVTDFGMVRQFDSGTIKTSTFGTVSYMAPEIIKQGQLRPSADVYSFGVILWELVDGRKAWGDMRHVQVMAQKLSDPLLRVSNHRAGAWFQPIIDICMSADHTQRPTFAEVIEFLEATMIKT
jgi:hypothetical protein